MWITLCVILLIRTVLVNSSDDVRSICWIIQTVRSSLLVILMLITLKFGALLRLLMLLDLRLKRCVNRSDCTNFLIFRHVVKTHWISSCLHFLAVPLRWLILVRVITLLLPLRCKLFLIFKMHHPSNKHIFGSMHHGITLMEQSGVLCMIGILLVLIRYKLRRLISTNGWNLLWKDMCHSVILI